MTHQILSRAFRDVERNYGPRAMNPPPSDEGASFLDVGKRAMLAAGCLLLGLLVGAVLGSTYVMRADDDGQSRAHSFLSSVGALAMANLLTGDFRPNVESPIEQRKRQREAYNKALVELKAERSGNRQLRGTVAKLNADSASRKVEFEKMRGEILEKDRKLSAMNARLEESRAQAKRVSASVNHRARKMAGRNIAGAAAEAIPFIGTAVVAALVAADVLDLCATLKESRELNPDLPALPEGDYCGYEVPSVAEIRASLSSGAKGTYDNAAARLKEFGIELKQYRVMTLQEVGDVICATVSLPYCRAQ